MAINSTYRVRIEPLRTGDGKARVVDVVASHEDEARDVAKQCNRGYRAVEARRIGRANN